MVSDDAGIFSKIALISAFEVPMVNLFPVTVTPPDTTCHSLNLYPLFGDAVSVTDATCARFTRLDKRTRYKAYVQAWKRVDGRKVAIGAPSPEVHAITGGYDGKYCNARSVTLNKSRLTLKVGRRATLRASVEGVKASRKPLQHVRLVR